MGRIRMDSITANLLLAPGEACRIIELVQPHFDAYVARFNETKYPPEVHQRLQFAFAKPNEVSRDDIRLAILWKFGHLIKKNPETIPNSHKRLISDIWGHWPTLITGLSGPTAAVYDRLIAAFGGAHRFITVSFFLLLLRPAEIPIIDQHNFRAVNHFLGLVRPALRAKRAPRSYEDLMLVSAFLGSVRTHWQPPAPSESELDRFLMTYGQALRKRGPEVPVADHLSAPNVLDAGHIPLPFGGPGASFAVNELIAHLRSTGRNYIIQGQVHCAMAVHPKPQSLDVWLRKTFAKQPDMKQAVNDVISNLVSTGLFTVGMFICPDSGRFCKGVQFVPSRDGERHPQ